MPYKDKEVSKARNRERYATDPEFRRKSRAATEAWEASLERGKWYTPEYGRAKQLERRYKITPQEYDTKLEEQGGHCALCEAVQGTHKRRMTIDHDHNCCDNEKACGKCNRGILCANCNRKIGFLEEMLREAVTPPIPTEGTWLSKAIQYLTQYKV